MREPPAAFRQQRTEELNRQFQADVKQVLDALSAGRKRFRGDVPPLALLAIPQTEAMDAFRRAEVACRERIDAVIRGWIKSGEWPDSAATEEFWLATRFEHALWLANCLFCPDKDGILRYLPTYGGHLLRGFREWLLIHTWGCAGCDRFLSDLD